jgi:hypothetical protein
VVVDDDVVVSSVLFRSNPTNRRETVVAVVEHKYNYRQNEKSIFLFDCHDKNTDGYDPKTTTNVSAVFTEYG